LFLTAAVTAISGIALVAGGRYLLHAWVGDIVAPSMSLMIGLALWSGVSAIGTTQAMVLNGLGALRIQALCAVIATCLALAGKIFLVSRIGVAGAVWATVPVYVLVVLIPSALATRHCLRSVKTQAGQG
jgi:hypothetical protein